MKRKKRQKSTNKKTTHTKPTKNSAQPVLSWSICQTAECLSCDDIRQQTTRIYLYELSGMYWHLSNLILFILTHRIPVRQYYACNADGEQRLNTWLKDTSKILALDVLAILPICMGRCITSYSCVDIQLHMQISVLCVHGSIEFLYGIITESAWRISPVFLAICQWSLTFKICTNYFFLPSVVPPVSF